MAMASILGLTTAEALNVSCCSSLRVTESNRNYINLLERTGLPGIEEMAMLDACSAINQASGMKPEWFLTGTKRQQESSSDFLKIIGVRTDCAGTLMH